MYFVMFAPIISIGLSIIILIFYAIFHDDSKRHLPDYNIINQANKIAEREYQRPSFIKEFGTYISQFPEGEKIYYSDLVEKFKDYNQDLPDIFELNDFLHTINCEAIFVNNYYMVVPFGSTDFESKKEYLKKKNSTVHLN